MILDPERRRRREAEQAANRKPEFEAPRSRMTVANIRRAILIGMLVMALGYRAAVYVGWIAPVTARAPATAAAPAGTSGAAGTAAGEDANSSIPTVTLVQPDAGEVARAFEEHRSGVQVHGSGTVERVLADDTQGSRHQRFILRMPDGQSVLFAHNIDLAGRIEGLAPGTRVEFAGEYEWNEKGGLVHWTHRDPSGHHPAGWLKVGGVIYR